MIRILQRLAPFAVLVAAVVLAYGRTCSFGFIFFDDPDYTFACPFVKDGLTLANLKAAFLSLRHAAVWMPVTWISYMLDISLFGAGAAGHHVVNVALHALNAVLLMLWIGRLCSREGEKARWMLAAVVACWALHPQRIEAVAWIASRKELLWALFLLLGLLAHGSGRLFAVAACCLLACMSKPTAMVFPALLALGAFSFASAPAPRRTFGACAAWGTMGVAAAGTALLAVYSQTHPEGMAVKNLFYAGFLERLLNAAVAVGLSIAQGVVPSGIHLDYRAVPGGWPVDGTLGLVVFSGAALAFGFFLAYAWRTRPPAARRIAGVGGWFLVALAPTLGLFGSFGEQARADRFLYVPTMAFAAGAAFLLAGKASIFRVLAAGALAILLGACAQPALASYRHDEAAFARTLACDPGHGRALAHVGEALCARGELDRGIDLLAQSQALRPRDATLGKLAYALMRRGRAGDFSRIREICAPVAADPARDEKGQSLEALGTAALSSRDWRAAADFLARSIRAPKRFYSSLDAELKLAFALHNGGRREAARRLFERVSRSSRADLSGRADRALALVTRQPGVVLFW